MSTNMIEELRPLTSWNSFAASLVNQYDRGKGLSERQVTAARAMLDKMALTSKAKAEAASVDLSRVHDMFAAAIENGLKRPTFRFGNIKLSLASATSINFGAVYVKREGEYAGKVQDGVFRPVAATAREGKAIAESLATIAADPLEAAREYGRATGYCACCGRLLTAAESVGRGVGPICAERWGLL